MNSDNENTSFQSGDSLGQPVCEDSEIFEIRAQDSVITFAEMVKQLGLDDEMQDTDS